MNILIVNDDPVERDSMNRLLAQRGYYVEAVGDSRAALDLLAYCLFDVIIADFSMPGSRPDRLVAQIRQLLPAQRIIMVTGQMEEYKMFSQPLGNVNVLVRKPVSLRELDGAIERALQWPSEESLPPSEL